jgi:uncharacterized protein
MNFPGFVSKLWLARQSESMNFAHLPATAAWQHQGARTGFEVTYFQSVAEGFRMQGCTTAIEDGQPWAVEYTIDLDAGGATRRAQISGRSAAGLSSALLESDGAGRWLVGGVHAAHLDGCLDVDLESSAMTNALPVRRMGLAPDARATAPAAYIRAIGLGVDRLEQTYLRTSDKGSCQRYDYAAPAFDFTARLIYDESGLVLDYPGIAVRAG